jgi:hypothetical protein
MWEKLGRSYNLLPNHSLPQKISGIIVSRPRGRRDLEAVVLIWES